MKYHSTKNTIVTIMFILSSLFIISFLGIKYLNAKTPIEAVATALVENLELPSDYRIEIININKSFLMHQKIDSIEIKKGDKVFLKLVNVEFNHSVLDYFKLLIFHSSEKLQISANSIEINFNKYFYDITSGLNGLKIKDNTFPRISKDEIINPINLEKSFDLNLFRDQIQKNGAINVSAFLPANLRNSSLDLKIYNGILNFDDDNLKANTMFKDFELNISSNSYLTKIKTEVTKFNLSNNLISLKADYANIDFEKTNFDINCTNLLFINNEIKLGTNSLNISYSLLDLERATINYDKLQALYKKVNINVEKGSSKVDSNFKDFSIYNTFDNINVNINNSTFESSKIDLNASFVNKSLAIILTTGPKNYLSDEVFGKLDFSNLNASLSSDTLLPTSVNVKINRVEFSKDNNIINVNNLLAVISSDVDVSPYLKEDGSVDFTHINLQNLKESYKEIKATISSESSGFLKSIDNNFTAKIYSTMLFEDSLNQLTATIDLDNTKLSKINDELNVSIAYQGPLSLNNDKLKMLETHIDIGDSIKSSIVASSKEGIKEATIEGNIEFSNFMPSSVLYYVHTYSPLIANYVDKNTTINGSFNFSGNYDEKAFLKVKGDIDSSLILNNLVFGTTPISLGLSLSSLLNENDIDFTKFSIASFGYRLAGSGVYNAITNLPKIDFSVSSIKNGTKLFTTSLYQKEGKLGFNILIPNFESFKFSGMINQLDKSDINLTTELDISKDVYPLTVNVNRKNYNISAFSDKGLDFNLSIGKSIKASLLFDNLFSKTLDNSYLAGALSYSASDIGEWEFG
ncbi:MAG: hypothetical protein JJE21_05840, partial [Spirochaetaceae bacterium]|nr:hypothetical protein [Spirochaetaceae bacterium]